MPATQPIGPSSTRIRPGGRSGSRSKGGGSRSRRSSPDKHAGALYEGSNGDPAREAVWTYLFDGPYRSLEEFRAAIELKARSDDPLFFAVVDNATGRAVGYQTLMRIDAANRVIEVGNVMYTPAMQRTPGATEAQYLFARHVFEALGYRRYEWKCHALNAPSSRAADQVRLYLRGDFSPAHDRQGPQSRHGVVRHARQRMAGAQGGLRALASAGQFRCRGPTEAEALRTHAEGE